MAVDWDGRGSPHLSLTWLPTSTHPGGQLERVDMGVMMRDFAIDPSQDLIVLVVSDAIARYVSPSLSNATAQDFCTAIRHYKFLFSSHYHLHADVITIH